MFFVLSLVVCALGVSLQGAEAASCHLREVDLCLATVLLGASEGIPANDEELDKVCEPVQEGIECIGNYSASCFTPLLQEVFDMAMYEPKKYQNLMCTHGTDERAEYLKHAPCLQKALSNDNVRPHLEDLMAGLEKAAESQFQDRVPIMCCGLQRMYKNLLDIVEGQCGKGVVDQGGALIGMSASSISDIFCRGYEPGTPRCGSLLPPQGTQSQGSNSKIQLIQFLNTAISSWQ
ncbi:uncharacterized protein LOC129967034 [Argiope bruennichi]|uniref:Uncharacterized protein n=1 Tax=Argiope bruennichi TaxID=94029 RepID=A0A8T0EB35_ARGBR|nr:uncharacterized protein LOC129967034 [Argiope bruennichi]KAF8767661.1 hypothetical protein HNY73_020583 [Argiope bruennichi]